MGARETPLQKSIIEALKVRRDVVWIRVASDPYVPPPAAAEGKPWAVMWRQNAGQTVVGKGAKRRFIYLGPAGVGDICGVAFPSGRFGFLETKTEFGALSGNQERARDLFIAAGAFVTEVRCIPDAMADVDAWLGLRR